LGAGAAASRWGLAAGLALSAVCLYLALRQVDPAQAAQVLGRARPLWVAATVAALLAQGALRGWRWRLLLGPAAAVGLAPALRAYFIGAFANMILPLRAGDLVRAVALGRLAPAPASAGLASVVVERLLDLFSVAILAAAVLALLPLPAWLEAAAWGALAAAVAGGAALFGLRRGRRLVLGLTERAERLLPARLRGRLSRPVALFISGLQGLGGAGRYLLLAGQTAAAWALAVGAVYCLFVAYGLDASPGLGPLQALAVTVLVTLGISVPSAPGFVGTVHLAAMAGLTQFGVARDAALAWAVAYHLLTLTALSGAGLACLAGKGLGMGWLLRVSRRPAQDPPR
jgi:hypothetical protein